MERVFKVLQITDTSFAVIIYILHKEYKKQYSKYMDIIDIDNPILCNFEYFYFLDNFYYEEKMSKEENIKNIADDIIDNLSLRIKQAKLQMGKSEDFNKEMLKPLNKTEKKKIIFELEKQINEILEIMILNKN